MGNSAGLNISEQAVAFVTIVAKFTPLHGHPHVKGFRASEADAKHVRLASYGNAANNGFVPRSSRLAKMSVRLHRAHSGSAPAGTLADAATESIAIVSRDAARKAAIRSKRSEISHTNVRVAGQTGLPALVASPCK